jgi:hypothetical protein
MHFGIEMRRSGDERAICGLGLSVACQHESGVHSCTQATLRTAPYKATVTELIHAMVGQVIAQPVAQKDADSKVPKRASVLIGVIVQPKSGLRSRVGEGTGSQGSSLYFRSPGSQVSTEHEV